MSIKGLMNSMTRPEQFMFTMACLVVVLAVIGVVLNQ